MMNEDQFWTIIEDSFSGGDQEAGLDACQATLEEMSRDEVVEFQRVMNDVMIRACRWDLIGAACFLGCGQSNDGFEDFRAWLISLGRQTFEKVLSDPNVIATFEYDESPTEEWHFMELHMLPGEIAGEEDDDDWPYLEDPRPPAGEKVELRQAALQERFPTLWEHFGNQFMIAIP